MVKLFEQSIGSVENAYVRIAAPPNKFQYIADPENKKTGVGEKVEKSEQARR